MRNHTSVTLRDLDKEIIREAMAMGADVQDATPAQQQQPQQPPNLGGVDWATMPDLTGGRSGQHLTVPASPHEDSHSERDRRTGTTEGMPPELLAAIAENMSAHGSHASHVSHASHASHASGYLSTQSVRSYMSHASAYSALSHSEAHPQPLVDEEGRIVAEAEPVLVNAGVKKMGTKQRKREAAFWEKTRRPIASDLERIQRASLFIEDAISSRPIKVTRLGPGPVAAYRIYHNRVFRALMSVIVALHMSLAFFEAPRAGDSPALGEDWRFPLLWVEVVCLTSFFVDLCISLYAIGVRAYIQSIWSVIHVVALFAMGVDVILAFAGWDVRPTRVLRWIPIMLNSVSLKHLMYCTFHTVTKLYDMTVIVCVLLLTFAILGVQMFGINEVSPSAIGAGTENPYRDPVDGSPLDGNFDNIGEAMLSLLVLLSTENYPDIMYPALDASPIYAVFFIVFILVGIFIFFSVLTAIIFDMYKEIHETRIIAARVEERKGLIAAFQILDKNRTGYLHMNQWVALMAEWKPKMSMERACFLFKTMDHDGDNTIDLLEFFDILEIMRYEIEESSLEKRTTKWTECGTLSVPALARLADAPWFGWFINTCIVLNVLILCLYRSGMSQSELSLYERLDVVFVIIFTCEQVIKFIGYGRTAYWSDTWNRYDLGILVLSLMATGLELFSDDDNKSASSIFVSLRVLRLFRTLRTLRLINTARQFETLMQTFLHLGRVIIPISVCIVVAFYSYAILGMELFGGKLSPSQVPGADPYTDFETFPRTLLAIFQLFTTSNWHEIMYTAREGAGKASALYFVSFFIVMILLFNNILLAITYEIFTFQRNLVEQEERSKARISFMNKSFHIKQGGRTWDRALVTSSLEAVQQQELQALARETNVDWDDVKDRQRAKRVRLLGEQGAGPPPPARQARDVNSDSNNEYDSRSDSGSGGSRSSSGDGPEGRTGSMGNFGSESRGMATFATAVSNVAKTDKTEQDHLRELASIVVAKRRANRARTRQQAKHSPHHHHSSSSRAGTPTGKSSPLGSAVGTMGGNSSRGSGFPSFSLLRRFVTGARRSSSSTSSYFSRSSGSSSGSSSFSRSRSSSSSSSSSGMFSSATSTSNISYGPDPHMVLSDLLFRRQMGLVQLPEHVTSSDPEMAAAEAAALAHRTRAGTLVTPTTSLRQGGGGFIQVSKEKRKEEKKEKEKRKRKQKQKRKRKRKQERKRRAKEKAKGKMGKKERDARRKSQAVRFAAAAVVGGGGDHHVAPLHISSSTANTDTDSQISGQPLSGSVSADSVVSCVATQSFSLPGYAEAVRT